MKKLNVLFILLIGLLFAFPVFSQNEEESAAMAAWMESIAPDDNHAWLAGTVGKWSYVMTSYMQGGEMKSNGTAEYEMIMGGRYLLQKTKADMGGMLFEGMGITAYDKSSKKYLSSWIDTFGTGILNFEGDRTDEGLEMIATYFNPMTQSNEKHRMLIKVVDENTSEMHYWSTPEGGEETKAMLIEYTRK